MRISRVVLAVAAVVSFGVWLHGEQPGAPQFEFRYHTYSQSMAALKGLASRYPQLARLYSIGRSATETKDLWCIEIGNQKTGSAQEKPATYFDGNQHASEVVGGEVTLYLAHYLLENYGKDPAVTRLVDTRVTYIVQRADPDGAEAYLTGKIDWNPETVPGARDLDGDGRKGEDGPDDIDGDGEILKVRVVDPNGDWKPYKPEPRLMVRREKDDREGLFYRLLDEGIDNDGDGAVNEDPPVTGFISNRNYPAFWASDDGRYRGSGDFPLQESNARLLVDFIARHREISEIESYHTTSGIHLRPYAARPDTNFPPQDLHDFSAILSKGTEITGYPVASIYNDFTDIQPNLPPDAQPDVRHGVFVDWAYAHLGLFAVTTELWTLDPYIDEIGAWGSIPRDKPLYAIAGRYNRPDVQAAFLKWLDAKKGSAALDGQGFVDWKSYAHPTLGKVELGGFTKYILRNPPPGPYFQKLVTDQVKFAVVQALTTPLVRIKSVDVKRDPAGGGGAETGAARRWLVTATIVNEGYLDTATEQARLARLASPVEVTVETRPGQKVEPGKRIAFPFLRGTRGSALESTYTAAWRIEAADGARATVVVRSEKGGTDRRVVVLADTPGR